MPKRVSSDGSWDGSDRIDLPLVPTFTKDIYGLSGKRVPGAMIPGKPDGRSSYLTSGFLRYYSS
jgi:hypothetical protein